MNILKLIPMLLALWFAFPALAEPLTQPDLEMTEATELADEQAAAPVDEEAGAGGDGTFITGFQKAEREGPATATDKIVDRFMELNTNPEESAGVDFEEYFTMVRQRAEDRFKLMDANGDEEVTAEEYREFWKSQKAQYYRLKR